MNWQSLVIIGIIVILFVILMIINASTNELENEDNHSSSEDKPCKGKCPLHHHKPCPKHKSKTKKIPDVSPIKKTDIKKIEPKKAEPKKVEPKKIDIKKSPDNKKTIQITKSVLTAKTIVKKTKNLPPKKKK